MYSQGLHYKLSSLHFEKFFYCNVLAKFVFTTIEKELPSVSLESNEMIWVLPSYQLTPVNPLKTAKCGQTPDITLRLKGGFRW